MASQTTHQYHHHLFAAPYRTGPTGDFRWAHTHHRPRMPVTARPAAEDVVPLFPSSVAGYNYPTRARSADMAAGRLELDGRRGMHGRNAEVSPGSACSPSGVGVQAHPLRGSQAGEA